MGKALRDLGGDGNWKRLNHTKLRTSNRIGPGPPALSRQERERAGESGRKRAGVREAEKESARVREKERERERERNLGKFCLACGG